MIDSEVVLAPPAPHSGWRHPWLWLDALLNRDMPPGVVISLGLRWPLLLIPIFLFNQIFAPHPVWIALIITLIGIYGLGYAWVRSQARTIVLERTRVGAILVAGDTLHEEFELRNDGRLPVLWAEVIDGSNLPGYTVGRVVGCAAGSFVRWRTQVVCRQRGMYRLGPHRLVLGDPFGLYALAVDFAYADALLIYPRVVHLPNVQLPHGNASGADRRRRPLRGSLPAASVSEYRPGDSLRHIHWPTTAHRGRLMVKELEIEPSGDVWIVLDLHAAGHRGSGELSTLEYAVVVAASLAAELLAGGERRAVGLLTVSAAAQAVLAPPLPGQAQLWEIMASLAPVAASQVSLAELLRSSRAALGRRRTLIVITPQVPLPGDVVTEWAADGSSGAEPSLAVSAAAAASHDWLAELVHLKSLGLDSTVLFIAPASDGAELSSDGVATGTGNVDREAATLRGLLAQQDIPLEILQAGQPLQAALTFRRRRTVVRTTPTGGVVTYEVEEEVG